MMNIILRKGKYALIDRGHEYIVACGFDDTQPQNEQWDYGLHFEHWNESEDRKAEALSNALNHYRERTDENYSPTRVLEIYREDYSEGDFLEILRIMNVNNDEVGDALCVYANVVRSTLKEV